MMLPVIGDCCTIVYDTPRPSHQRQILTVKSASEQFPTVKIVMSWIRRLVLENIGANLQLLYNCVLYTYTVTPKTELDCEISLRAVSHVKITMGWIPRLVSDNVGANRRLLYDSVRDTAAAVSLPATQPAHQVLAQVDIQYKAQQRPLKKKSKLHIFKYTLLFFEGWGGFLYFCPPPMGAHSPTQAYFWIRPCISARAYHDWYIAKNSRILGTKVNKELSPSIWQFGEMKLTP